MFKNSFKKGIGFGLGIGLGIISIFGIVNAWSDLTSVSNGDTLTETIWNNMVTKINEIGNNTSGIYTDSNGKVGIGTQTPYEKLHISNGDVAIDNNNSLLFRNSGDNGSLGIKSDLNDNLTFRNGGFWDRLVITDNGNVGIGTNTPTTKLDIDGTTKANVFDIGYEIVTNSLYEVEWNGSYSISAICPTGKKVIGGGCNGSRSNPENNNIYKSYPYDNGWRCISYSSTTYDLTLTAYAICANVE